MTGFSEAAASTIRLRSGNRCERCGGTDALQIHHRSPRGMGGSHRAGAQRVNQVSNGVRLCQHCHHWAESNRSAAGADGLLIARDEDPASTPVLLTPWCGRGFYILTADGMYETAGGRNGEDWPGGDMPDV